jgi:hypothetical protein
MDGVGADVEPTSDSALLDALKNAQDDLPLSRGEPKVLRQLEPSSLGKKWRDVGIGLLALFNKHSVGPFLRS